MGIVSQLHHPLAHLTAEEPVMLPLAGGGLGRRRMRDRAREELDRIVELRDGLVVPRMGLGADALG